MQIQNIHEQQVLGTALIILGLSLGGSAAAFGLLAVEHMSMTTAMCGPTFGHCVRCIAAGTLLVAAIGTCGTGARLLQSRGPLQRAG
jgi:hypothetical protein